MDDLISRKAAIDAVCRHETELERRGITVLSVVNHKQATVDLLESLPSAQSEIIRCRDCKNWDTTWTNNWAPDYHYCPMIDGVRKCDFYCADAERRSDE